MLSSSRQRFGWFLATVSGAVMSVGVSGPPRAVASTDPGISAVVVTSAALLENAMSSITEIPFDAPVTEDEARAAIQDIFGLASVERQGSTLTATALAEPTIEVVALPTYPEDQLQDQIDPATLVEDQDDGGDTYFKVYCDKEYIVRDSLGKYTVQRACGNSVSPWGWKMSAELQKYCASDVFESGMKWTKNGSNMPMGSPHTEGCAYPFHGSYNPVVKGDKISYDDSFKFRHNIGQGGWMQVNIFEDLWYKGKKAA